MPPREVSEVACARPREQIFSEGLDDFGFCGIHEWSRLVSCAKWHKVEAVEKHSTTKSTAEREVPVVKSDSFRDNSSDYAARVVFGKPF